MQDDFLKFIKAFHGKYNRYNKTLNTTMKAYFCYRHALL